ncbi:MAG: amidohydrolase family protein, partial [Pirellulaceae bacterium]|nr:amidohydrolase family protein [Pirellulaceae bacterium]
MSNLYAPRFTPDFLMASIRHMAGLALLLLGMAIGSTAEAQTATSPDEGILSRPARTTLFRGGRVTVSAQRPAEVADILVRDGKVIEVAEQITAPVDAEIIECQGKYLYPAFIDPLVEQAVPHTSRPDDHWNAAITPHRQALSALPNDDKVAAQYRRAGFGAILIAPGDGIIKGTSTVVSTAKLPVAQTVLRSQAFQHFALVRERGPGGYPNSPMGVVALTRQTLSDAQWYQQAQQAFRADSSLPSPDKNAALEALAALVNGNQTALFDSGNELYAIRADRMAREFNLRAVIRGSGREYRRLDDIAQTGRTYIVPVDFPKPPEVSSLEAATSVTLQAMMHWQLAPENPARLEAAQVNFVLSAVGLMSPNELLENVRKAVGRGLEGQAALSALTTRTARLLEIDHLVGSLERGKLANLLIVSGPLWEKKSTIEETWVQGERYRWQDRDETDASGRWQLTATGEEPLPKQLELQLEGMTEKPKGSLALPGELDKASPTPAKPTQDDSTPAGPKKNEPATDAKPDEPSAISPSDKPEKALELKKPDSDNPPNNDGQPKPVVPAPDAGNKAAVPPTAQSGQSSESSDSKPPVKAVKPEDKPADKPAKVAELKPLSASDYRIEAMFDAKKLVDDQKGFARLALTVMVAEDKTQTLIGRILWPDGRVSLINGTRAKVSEGQPVAKEAADKPPEAKATLAKEVVCEVNFPLGAFGVSSAP